VADAWSPPINYTVAMDIEPHQSSGCKAAAFVCSGDASRLPLAAPAEQADIGQTQQKVRFCPKADLARLQILTSIKFKVVPHKLSSTAGFFAPPLPGDQSRYSAALSTRG
jgi:hypothetical protein